MSELDRTIRHIGARNFQDIKPVRQALSQVRQYPSGFGERVDIFDAATFDISTDVVLGEFDGKQKPYLQAFRNIWREIDEEPFVLSDVVGSYRYFLENAPDDEFLATTNGVIQELKDELVAGNLKFAPEVFSNPNTLLTRLLLEGYVMNMGAHYKIGETEATYRKAIKETLVKNYPRSSLTADLLWWEQIEADQSRIVSLAEYEKSEKERQSDPLKVAADKLNRRFQENTPAYCVLEDIRLFPRPILVDFNNVISNNSDPLRLNPESPNFLNVLRQIGNIFIVTSASGWKNVQGFMVESRIWHPDMVLMTSPIWEFITMDDKGNNAGETLRQDFLKRAKSLGWDCEKRDLYRPSGYKCVAPIFDKPWELPFIDNDGAVTNSNPGILGIRVKEWISDEDDFSEDYKEWLNEENESKKSLREAADLVRDYYAKLSS